MIIYTETKKEIMDALKEIRYDRTSYERHVVVNGSFVIHIKALPAHEDEWYDTCCKARERAISRYMSRIRRSPASVHKVITG